MRRPFAYTLSAPDKRPMTEFAFDLRPKWTHDALLDSGSNRTWIDRRIADALEIDLGEEAESTLLLGNAKYKYRTAEVSLRIERYRWTSEVCFVDNWNVGHQILGLKGIFDFFDVRINPLLELTELKSRGYPRVETLRSPL